MKVSFKKSFIKDFQKLPSEIQEEVKKICFCIFPEIKDLKQVHYNIKKLKGSRFYYRIKVKQYRIGFKKIDDEIIFMRVLHRKEIYRHF